MIRTVIVDDEPAIRRDLSQLMESYPGFLVVAACGSIKEALPVIRATRPQLVLLDISLEDGNGFEILQHFQPAPFHTVFITAYNDHAIKAIRIGALDYLLKPIDEDDLRQALEKVRAAAQHRGPAQEQLDVAQAWLGRPGATDRIVLRTQEYLQVVPLQEIVYCRSDAGYTYFYLTDKRKVVVSKSIKEYEEILPPHLFIRSHQSYLVNYLFVDRFVKDGLLVLRTGEEIPVSSRRKDYVVQFLTGK